MNSEITKAASTAADECASIAYGEYLMPGRNTSPLFAPVIQRAIDSATEVISRRYQMLTRKAFRELEECYQRDTGFKAMADAVLFNISQMPHGREPYERLDDAIMRIIKERDEFKDALLAVKKVLELAELPYNPDLSESVRAIVKSLDFNMTERAKMLTAISPARKFQGDHSAETAAECITRIISELAKVEKMFIRAGEHAERIREEITDMQPGEPSWEAVARVVADRDNKERQLRLSGFYGDNGEETRRVMQELAMATHNWKAAEKELKTVIEQYAELVSALRGEICDLKSRVHPNPIS